MTSNPNALLKIAESTDFALHEEEQTIAIVGSCQSSANLAVSFGYAFNIVNAKGTNELFAAMAQQDIDLVILTTALDNSSWIDQLKLICNHSTSNFIPTIVLSESHSVNQQLIALELGAIDYMAIPANPFLLDAKVNNYMQLMKKVKLLELEASNDGLTGLATRTQLDTTLSKEWYRMKRSNRTLSALMIDVDSFHDEFAQLGADEGLKAVAGAIAKVAGRESDFAARFGTEEFVVLLPCTERTGAQKVAKAVLKEVQALRLRSTNKYCQYLTVSIGICSCEPHKMNDRDSDPSWLLHQADKSLYKAKQQGPNTYCG